MALSALARMSASSSEGPSIAKPIEAPTAERPALPFDRRLGDGRFERARLGGRVGFAQIPQHEPELIAAEPRDRIGGAHAGR